MELSYVRYTLQKAYPWSGIFTDSTAKGVQPILSVVLTSVFCIFPLIPKSKVTGAPTTGYPVLLNT